MLKKIYIILFMFIVLCGCTFTPDSKQKASVKENMVEHYSVEAIQKRGFLRVGVKSFSWAWFQKPGYEGKDDKWYGWENEYVKRFADDLGVDIQYVKYEDGERQFKGLKKGEVDLVMTSALIESYNVNDEYTTSIPYNTWGSPDFKIVLRKDDSQKFHSKEELSKAKIGLADDESLYQSTLKAFPQADIERMDYTSDVMYDLLEGYIDAAVIYGSEFDYYSEDYFQLSQVTVPVYSEGMGVFMMKGNESLKAFIDEEIEAINQEDLGLQWSDQYYLLAKSWQVNGVE